MKKILFLLLTSIFFIWFNINNIYANKISKEDVKYINIFIEKHSDWMQKITEEKCWFLSWKTYIKISKFLLWALEKDQEVIFGFSDNKEIICNNKITEILENKITSEWLQKIISNIISSDFNFKKFMFYYDIIDKYKYIWTSIFEDLKIYTTFNSQKLEVLEDPVLVSYLNMVWIREVNWNSLQAHNLKNTTIKPDNYDKYTQALYYCYVWSESIDNMKQCLFDFYLLIKNQINWINEPSFCKLDTNIDICIDPKEIKKKIKDNFEDFKNISPAFISEMKKNRKKIEALYRCGLYDSTQDFIDDYTESIWKQCASRKIFISKWNEILEKYKNYNYEVYNNINQLYSIFPNDNYKYNIISLADNIFCDSSYIDNVFEQIKKDIEDKKSCNNYYLEMFKNDNKEAYEKIIKDERYTPPVWENIKKISIKNNNSDVSKEENNQWFFKKIYSNINKWIKKIYTFVHDKTKVIAENIKNIFSKDSKIWNIKNNDELLEWRHISIIEKNIKNWDQESITFDKKIENYLNNNSDKKQNLSSDFSKFINNFLYIWGLNYDNINNIWYWLESLHFSVWGSVKWQNWWWLKVYWEFKNIIYQWEEHELLVLFEDLSYENNLNFEEYIYKIFNNMDFVWIILINNDKENFKLFDRTFFNDI